MHYAYKNLLLTVDKNAVIQSEFGVISLLHLLKQVISHPAPQVNPKALKIIHILFIRSNRITQMSVIWLVQKKKKSFMWIVFWVF